MQAQAGLRAVWYVWFGFVVSVARDRSRIRKWRTPAVLFRVKATGHTYIYMRIHVA
jgi:hypothetical protein